MQRRAFFSRTAALAAGLAGATLPARATGSRQPSVVIACNQALMGAIAATATQAPVAARACSMVHEAIYNAWAAYQPRASFTLSAMRRRPSSEWSDPWRVVAVCRAAYTVLCDLFPSQVAVFDALMDDPVLNWLTGLSTGRTARQTGELAGNAMIAARRQDGSNQYGDLAPGAYADWTGYVPVNTPDQIVDIDHWQPLRLVGADGVPFVQKYLTPHWPRVRPFALSSASVFRPTMSHRAPSWAEMNELIGYSAALDDYKKSLVDLWAANPGTVSPPGQWMEIAEQVSDADDNDLDADVKMFFACAQALHDAAIACWDVKRVYDSVRPITAIRYHYRGQSIRAWGGPGRGTQTIRGENWSPFQRPQSITPPFPEFCSGHSTFSASAATVLAGLRGSDRVTVTGSIAAGSLRVDPGYPTVTVNFSFPTLSAAADSAGLSRRVGGIHFEQGDLAGRALGRRVGGVVLAKCRDLFNED